MKLHQRVKSLKPSIDFIAYFDDLIPGLGTCKQEFDLLEQFDESSILNKECTQRVKGLLGAFADAAATLKLPLHEARIRLVLSKFDEAPVEAH